MGVKNTMKLYVFVTCNASSIGGVQAYVSAKAEWLEKHGWDVAVLSNCMNDGTYAFETLRKYEKYRVMALDHVPSIYYSPIRNIVINNAIKLIGDYSKYDYICMESHHDSTSQWGELISERIGARHIVLLLGEGFRENGQHYEDKVDFYYFKFLRKEMFGTITPVKVFDGYYDVKAEDCTPFLIDEEPVRDVHNDKINEIKECDYNICYLGRLGKPYVPKIIEGIGKFANKYKENSVQFVIIGNTTPRRTMLDELKKSFANLTLTQLGEIVPIPRELFSKIDVMIAGAGSARCSAYEGMTTIVMDPERCMAAGFLGFETQSGTFWDGKAPLTSVEDALERALIKKAQNDLKFDYPKVGVSDCCKQNFKVIGKATKKKMYYGSKELCKGEKIFKENLKLILKMAVIKVMPGIYRKIEIKRAIELKKNPDNYSW